MYTNHHPEKLTSMLDKLSEKYGDMMPLTINRGKVHEYLGMVFDYSGNDDVKITMYQYIDSVIGGAPDVYKSSSRETGVGMATPAPSNLYDIRDPNEDGSDGFILLTNEAL